MEERRLTWKRGIGVQERKSDWREGAEGGSEDESYRKEY